MRGEDARKRGARRRGCEEDVASTRRRGEESLGLFMSRGEEERSRSIYF
jgi:hypothetical protein